MRMDKLVGETMERTLNGKDDTVLMVISDHGFSSFRRGIDLNAWLIENGFMTLQTRTPSWAVSTSRASTGSTLRPTRSASPGMFINQKGREAHGIVAQGAETEAVKAAIHGEARRPDRRPERRSRHPPRLRSGCRIQGALPRHGSRIS